MSRIREPVSYKEAGVDIDSGDTLVDAIRPLAKSTYREGCLGDVGSFGALFEVPRHFKQPVLVSGTDGVGTKVMLAFRNHRHDTIGIDLVAMCVNDVLSQGAEPLFFLDYFATGKLDTQQALAVMEGIAEGCRQAGAALIGGETAEMPGMYPPGKYDLAGFCVGAVERDQILDGRTIVAGDVLVGIASTGPHANGYSLIRHIVDTQSIQMDLSIDDDLLADLLLSPTRIYVGSVLSLIKKVPVHGIAHITGGGLPGNLERILPETCSALITACWEWPKIFTWLQRTGNIDTTEMYRTFNCGIGMVLVLPEAHAAQSLTHLRDCGDEAWIIGRVEPRTKGPRVTLT